MTTFTSSMAKKTGNTASISKAYPNRMGKKNKYSGSQNLLQGQGRGGGETRRNPYAMEVDRERNCYNCESFFDTWQDIVEIGE